MNNILIPGPTYHQIQTLLNQSKKIAAIKLLRSSVSGMDLMTAKWAVERMDHESGRQSSPRAIKEGPKIIAGAIIQKVTLDYGTGAFDLDLESHQLQALMDMQRVDISAVRSVLRNAHWNSNS